MMSCSAGEELCYLWRLIVLLQSSVLLITLSTVSDPGVQALRTPMHYVAVLDTRGLSIGLQGPLCQNGRSAGDPYRLTSPVLSQWAVHLQLAQGLSQRLQLLVALLQLRLLHLHSALLLLHLRPLRRQLGGLILRTTHTSSVTSARSAASWEA